MIATFRIQLRGRGLGRRILIRIELYVIGANRFRSRTDTAWSISPRLQWSSQGCWHTRPQAAGNGQRSRISS